MNEHKPSKRLRFEDETPEVLSDDLTSGQNGPKLKQRIKLRPDEEKVKPSERLRRDDDPLLHGEGATPGVDGAATNSAKKAAQELKHLEKSKLRMEKAGDKLNEAKDKLAAQKPLKRPGLAKRLGKMARVKAWFYVHKKIRELEHENVGIEAAHKTELAGEGVVRGTTRFAKRRIRTAPARRVRKLSKREVRAKANYTYHKQLQENPELRKKALSRFFHKRRLRKQYAKQAKMAAKHGKAAAHGAKQGGSLITKGTAALSKAAVALVKGNPKVWLIVGAAFLLIMLLQSCMAMVATIGNSTTGVVVATSYLAEDADIDDISVRYTEWETDLHYRIIHAERDNPGFDEYRFNIGDISHNPFELIAFLTAVYNDFTYAEVRGVMYEIFNEQYQLEFTPEVEIRTRTETRSGSWTDEDGNTHSYTYTVIVEYEWHILNITLTSRSFTSVILPRMDEEQLQRFHLLMLTKGNRQYLQSPFDFNWLPFVTSHYGYRIHPISGERSRHWGVDIGLPQGTEILSGQDGTVIFAGDAGGYGLLVVIDDGNGLVSRYAHCSVLYVSVGQVVSAGDIVARVGSTGNSTGPHLHLEIIKNGRHLNPLLFTVTNHHLDNPTLGGNPGAPMADGSFAAMLALAESLLGRPYVWGASGPNSFDCSGFVWYVLNNSGVASFGRTTAQGIFNLSTPISPIAAQPGDLIFFTGTFSTYRTVTHVGIYVGGGMMIHAGSPVQYASINTPFWQRHFYNFGRLN